MKSGGKVNEEWNFQSNASYPKGFAKSRLFCGQEEMGSVPTKNLVKKHSSGRIDFMSQIKTDKFFIVEGKSGLSSLLFIQEVVHRFLDIVVYAAKVSSDNYHLRVDSSGEPSCNTNGSSVAKKGKSHVNSAIIGKYTCPRFSGYCGTECFRTIIVSSGEANLVAELCSLFFKCPVAKQILLLSYAGEVVASLETKGWIREVILRLPEEQVEKCVMLWWASWKNRNEAMGCGGTFIAASSRTLEEILDPVHAEFLAFRPALKVAEMLQRLEYVIEGDAKGIIDQVLRGGEDRSPYGEVVNDIRRGMTKLEKCSVQWIRGTGNGAAHEIARRAKEFPEEVDWWGDPTTFLQQILAKDC
ncbi:hypothetical protein ACH5RR_026873 [Cinchona calisaya]|uniref:RNase H type-1 domain-containing protein n=1 Tax=Cinchona calisaya TaxID=153742 RepID=A0ABD2Z3V7_9GENT